MIRIALCLALLLLPAGPAAAESLRDALVGHWALLEKSGAADDAANVAEAEAICARPDFGGARGAVLSAEGNRFTFEAREAGAPAGSWRFDETVRGTRLDDGRIALAFSVGGAPSHEIAYWRTQIEGEARDLLQVLGPPVEMAIYMKCPG